MARLNLLPWREELRKEREKEFYIMLATAAVLAVALWGAIHYYHTLLIDRQNARNAFLEQEITKLDKKIEEIRQLEKAKEKAEKERKKALKKEKKLASASRTSPLKIQTFTPMIPYVVFASTSA